MREHISQGKKTTTSFSIPSLKHPTRGFGLESSAILRQAVPEIQPLHKPLTHDISRIPLRSPQAKLSISQPGDQYEQEADSVAQQVMQTIAQPINRQSIQREALPEEEELQMKPLDISTLQREALPEDEEELQMKSMVQRQGESFMAAAPEDLETSINQARGGGMAMADNIRHPMEQAFGADFSGVKVHTDGQSDQLNRSIQARAFTTGQDVFFRQGEYNPGSWGGQELLAHELTHVVQQNGEAVQRVVAPPDSKEDTPKEDVARNISEALNGVGINVFLGGAAAATLFTKTRKINDLDFRLDKQQRNAFDGDNGDNLIRRISDALLKKELNITKAFTKVERTTTTIRGEVNNVEVSITSEPSTEKTLTRGEAKPGLESIGQFAILLDKAKAAASRPKNKYDSVATDVYDIIKVKSSLPGGGTGILSSLDSYWNEEGLAKKLEDRLEFLLSTASNQNNSFSRGRNNITKNNNLLTREDFDNGIKELKSELSKQKIVTVL
ncbi:eCIS core domain-containing protein [Nostoc sp.]|uniref:eCIS core domain-containing protein n=1 Tax=Nostoc sp. TaxID=1180 RepID=UPI002FFAB928